MSVFGVVKGLKLRVTKTNTCGLPIAGPANRLVTDGFVSVELTPVMREAQDLEQLNAEGRVCVTDRTPPERKWYTVAAEFCNVDTELFSLLTSWPQVLDYNDDPIGFEDRKRVESDFGVALELWTGGKSDDDCPTPTTDDIFSAPTSGKKYGYLLTCATEWTLGNVRVAGEISTFTLTGLTYAMPQWGRGPYNVAAIDSSGTPGRMLEPMNNDSHFRLFRTPVAPPEVTNGAASLAINTIFVNPDYYFGGPANAPAADVAPDQAAEDQGYSLTTTGTPTGGTFSLTVVYPDQPALETAAIAYNATAAAVKTALVALDDGYDASDWVTSGGALPTAVVITPPDGVTVEAEDNNLTGGTTPTVVVTPV